MCKSKKKINKGRINKMFSVNIGFITRLEDWISKKLTNTREPAKEMPHNQRRRKWIWEWCASCVKYQVVLRNRISAINNLAGWGTSTWYNALQNIFAYQWRQNREFEPHWVSHTFGILCCIHDTLRESP